MKIINKKKKIKRNRSVSKGIYNSYDHIWDSTWAHKIIVYNWLFDWSLGSYAQLSNAKSLYNILGKNTQINYDIFGWKPFLDL